MKLSEVLRFVDKMKPGNPYDDSTKIQWLNELEGDIQSKLLKTAPQEIIQYTEADLEETLLIPVPFDKVYWMWVAAMIDFANGEYDRYQNSMQMVNDAYDKYAKWFHRHFHEDTGGFLYIGGTTKYGLSAYEIAVNHGFQGDIDAWLESIRGREVEVRVFGGHIQWKYTGETAWRNLISVDDLKGDQGEPGVLEVYEQPDEPKDALPGAIWFDTDDDEDAEAIALKDRSTGTGFLLYVENGKLTMEECEPELLMRRTGTELLDMLSLIDSGTGKGWILYIDNGDLKMEEATE